MKETKEKTEKKVTKKLSVSKSTVSNKNKVTKKAKVQKTTEKKVSNSKNKEIVKVLKANPKAQYAEYYDLPYRYNQTVIKILAQTPHALFVYWDISDSDKNEMVQKYGENFFNETKPILLVHNQTLNCSFEVEIDDFANSWYLRTPTSNCVFNIELGRKYILPENTKVLNNNENNKDSILHITSSNIIESPNDHVLKESFEKSIFIKNIKTNELEEIKISNLKPIKNLYNIFEFYNDEIINNPSSNFKI